MTETPEYVDISLELFCELSDAINMIPLPWTFLYRLCMINTNQDPVTIDRELFDVLVEKIVADSRFALAEKLWEF